MNEHTRSTTPPPTAAQQATPTTSTAVTSTVAQTLTPTPTAARKEGNTQTLSGRRQVADVWDWMTFSASEWGAFSADRWREFLPREQVEAEHWTHGETAVVAVNIEQPQQPRPTTSMIVGSTTASTGQLEHAQQAQGDA